MTDAMRDLPVSRLRPIQRTLEISRLERELAEKMSRADMYSHGIPERDKWFTKPDEESGSLDDFVLGCRYLELRGLIEKHPDDPSLVRPVQTVRHG